MGRNVKVQHVRAALTVFIVAIGDINIGPMYKEEMREEKESS